MSSLDDAFRPPPNAGPATVAHPAPLPHGGYGGPLGSPVPVPGQPWTPPAPPSRHGLHRGAVVGIVAGVVVLVLVVVGILAAIAVPVARNQRAKAQSVRFADLVTVAGLPVVEPNDDDEAVQSAMQAMEGDDRIVESVMTTYADDENAVDVAALRPGRLFSAANLRSIRARALAGAQESVDETLLLHAVAPGRAGGSLECATPAGEVQAVCYATDRGFVVQVVVIGTESDPVAVAREAVDGLVVRR